MAMTKLVATASSKIRPMRDSFGVAIRGFLCRPVPFRFSLSSRKQPELINTGLSGTSPTRHDVVRRQITCISPVPKDR
jgi:hypothetical protein